MFQELKQVIQQHLLVSGTFMPETHPNMQNSLIITKTDQYAQKLLGKSRTKRHFKKVMHINA